MDDNVSYVIGELYKELGVSISSDFLAERLRSNPFYPSFRAISDFLNETGVRHRIIKLTTEELIRAGGPFIAHTQERGGYMYFVKAINDEYVFYSDQRRGIVKIGTEELLEKWSGVALFADGNIVTDHKQIKHYREDKLSASLIRWGSGIMAFLILSLIATNFIGPATAGERFTFPDNIFLLTKITGLCFSILLLMHEMRIPSALINRLCHVSRNADCSSVTRSGLATLYGGVSLAEIGFAYFGGALLSMLVSPLGDSLPVVRFLSITSLPVPVVLILYQVIKIRKWCPLCMGVQAILITEGVLSLYTAVGLKLSVEGIVTTTASIVMVFLLLFYYRRYFQYRSRYLRERISSQKLKRDPVIIDAMLKKSSRIDISHNRYNLVFGLNSGQAHLTVFISLHCGACARIYSQVRTLTSSESRLSIQLVISTPPGNKEMQLSRMISSSHLSGDQDGVLKSLDDWFSQRVEEETDFIQEEAEIYTADANEFSRYNNKLFEEHDIKLVPAIFVNGYKLPEDLDINELKYYFEYIIEKTSSLEFPMQRKEVTLR